MLSISNFRTPEIFGVIFVDCWESYADNEFFTQMLRTLGDLVDGDCNRVPYTLFATYNYNLNRPDRTFSNSTRAFGEMGYFEQWMQTLIKNSTATQEFGAQLSYQFDSVLNDNSFLVQDVEMFNQLQTRYMSEITDWVVLGKSWNICYHNRPLGVKQIHEFYTANTGVPALNFYSSTWGVKCYDRALVEQDYIDDTLPWTTNGEIYKLDLTR